MKILITGGLGFIGVNCTDFFSKKNKVYVLDNLSRKGGIENYKKISNNENVTIHISDIRNYSVLSQIFEEVKPDVVIHLAGQVAVTTSVSNPRDDFESNLLGTFNILECIRNYCKDAILLFSSTNKVYGDFKSEIEEKNTRYEYKNLFSVSEDFPLDFHSPYGCSKGSADQYVRDYSRIYNIKSVVLRQSCIYGPNQFGIEDQGWVAWFTIASMFDKEFKIYGNGKQVRDILYIDDLINLYDTIIKNINLCSGKIYNAGGGVKNTLSLLELIEKLKIKTNKELKYNFEDWRPGDQKIYISDITKLKKDLGWEPKTDIDLGLDNLFNWVQKNYHILKELKLI